MKRTWKIELTVSVDDTWIADGFDASERIDQIQDLLAGDLLPYAYGHEIDVKAKVKTAPRRSIIRKLQGYQDARAEG